MTSDMLVSVIVPVYNVAPYLDEALGSVIAQSYRSLEVIVVDDGSTDGSGGICDKWAEADPRVTVVHQRNGGLSKARNVGLDLASGDAVAFLDPDDAWFPEFVERMIAEMRKADADMAACRYIPQLRFAEPAELLPQLAPGRYCREGALRALADGDLNQQVWNKVYRIWLWEGVRFPEGRVYEDVATTYRILDRCGTLLVLDKALCTHRNLRPGGITATRSISNALDSALAFSEFASFAAFRPGLFSGDQVHRLQALCLHGALLAWLHAVSDRDDALRGLADDLWALTLEIGAPEVLASCSAKTRFALHMLRRHPSLFAFVYRPYQAFRGVKRTINGH